MGYSLWKPIAVALAAAASSQQAAPPNIPTQSFEVDVVFPRNSTYKQTEIIPIVLAVQNLTTWTIGNSSVAWHWDIMSWPGGSAPGGIIYDSGEFQIPNDASTANPTFLIATTNSTQWHQHYGAKKKDEKYMLQWHATWSEADNLCHYAGWVPSLEAVMFDVQTKDEAANSAAIAVDISQGPKCPQFGQIAQISYDATATSCQLGPQTGSPQGNPCAVKVEGAIASSISSRVAGLAAPSTSPTAVPTSTSGGMGAARAVPTALAAAACILGGLVFS